jgi:anti-sigma factor RsiW
MVMHADGELTAAQEQELMSFLYEHPDLQSELTAFSMTRMIPDETETYAHKESLLKPVAAETPKVVAFPLWQRYAVAAGVAALLFVSGYRYLTPAVDNAEAVAHTSMPPNTTTPAVPQTVAQPAIAEVQGREEAREKTPADAIPVSTSNDVSGSTKQRAAITIARDVAPVAAVAMTEIDRVATAGVKELPEERKNIAAVVTNVLPLAIQYREDETEEVASFIDKLPIAETKKSGMKNLASEVASGYGKVNNIRQEIAQSVVSLTVTKKQLILSF